jgi:hypothetical protein
MKHSIKLFAMNALVNGITKKMKRISMNTDHPASPNKIDFGRNTARSLTMGTLLAAIIGCGANPYKSYEKSEPAEDATIALEEKDPDKAITILNAALLKEPENWVYVSILALAYAERAGISPMTLAASMAKNSGGTGNGVTSLFSVMPTATDEHIADVDKALELIISIPAASRTTADILKTAMFQTSALTLRSKKYDLNGDGVISAEEALAMSGADATAIFSQLASAAAAFASGNSTSTTDVAAAAQITSITAKIATCPGDDKDAQLKNYLSKTGC